ncbi:WD40-repeat-containing domain protein [Blakeslea trispora]|nr:WD40-repeat-containing domain protein [Blakeslea trispora]
MFTDLQQHIAKRRLVGTKAHIDEQVYSNNYITTHMTLEKVLPGHSGCINTLDWSALGDLLLTGSDDTKLNIYSMHDDYKILNTIDTGHTANIFTAKFMPQTSNRIILSGAGDAELRIFDITNPRDPLSSMYVCHSDQLKRICTLPDNPHEFFTCSQDGTVRHFDLRTPHMCSPHSVRSFISGLSKPARQNPLPKFNELHFGCYKPIVDYSKYKIELNSMSISKLYPHYFALAGMNDYIFLHDRRMLASSSSASNMVKSPKCVMRFSPRTDKTNRINRHITACKFSESNGHELIGSWSSDSIYLFDINDSPDESTYKTDSFSSSRRRRLSSLASEEIALNRQRKTMWKNSVSLVEQRRSHSALSAAYDLLQHIKNQPSGRSSMQDKIGEACSLFIAVAAYYLLRLDRDNWFSNRLPDPWEDWDRYFFVHELHIAQKLLQDAEGTASSIRAWQAPWCLAVGFWTVRGGAIPIADANRSWYLRKSMQYIEDARRTFMEQTRTIPSASPTDQLDSVHWEMMRLFLNDLQVAGARELGGHSSINTPNNEAQQWAQYMYITQYSVEELNSFITLRQTLHREHSTNNQNQASDESTSENDDNTIDFTPQQLLSMLRRLSQENSNEDEDESEDAENEESEEDNDDGNEDDEDDDDSYSLDLNELEIFRKRGQFSLETDVGVVKPRSKYFGHSNIETIKDVNFYGLQDEYIVSGSDGGHLFIWDKKTTKLVEILHADEEVVNIVEGHPSLPILAVSGIDSTTKIFTPTSRPFSTSRIKEPHRTTSYSASSHMYESQDIIRANREANTNSSTDIFITQSMMAALTRHRLSLITSEDDDEDEDVLYI